MWRYVTKLSCLVSSLLLLNKEPDRKMLKPSGFYVLAIHLSLAAGIIAAQGVPSGCILENRLHQLMAIPKLDHLHSGPGVAGNDACRDKHISVINTGVDVWFTEPYTSAQCQKIRDNWNFVRNALYSINPTLFVQVGGFCLVEEDILAYLVHPYGFRYSHNNNTVKKEVISNQQHLTYEGADHKSSHQLIVIMEDDPVVTESAMYIFDRHHTISTLLRYQKGALHILKGSHFSSTRNNDVVLVGHGRQSTNGTVLPAGYGPEELARLMLKIGSTFGHFGNIHFISCSLGSNLHFVMQLLQLLRSVSVETKLYLHNSFLSVDSNGQILSLSDPVWRSHDNSRRVIAELNLSGNLITKVESGCTGPAFSSYKGNVLYIQSLEWPSHPQMFVPEELRKKYPSIDCLEGLTWSLFFEENERRRAPDYVPDWDQKHMKEVWLTDPGPDQGDIIFKHISNIQDLLVEIRHNAREEIASDLYYVLNECIYKIHRKNLSVSLVGRFMNADNKAEIEMFRQNFNEPQGPASLQELRQDLKASKFNDFCRQTFQFQQCTYNCERWGRYFMAAVFCASVRNFRTFSLFLMSVIGCEVGRLRGSESSLCTAFAGDDHPMMTDEPWPEPLRRGFYGCTVDNFEGASPSIQTWLDQVVAKENTLYIRSKQMMNTVDHDEQTELDIFGKIKVMNKYVFSSYLEFFRGTPEGRKLKRGCTSSLH